MTLQISDGIRTGSPSRSGRWRATSALRVRGDGSEFSALYGAHHTALYRYCRSILRHDQDAQDAVQSTMEHAFAALQRERHDHDLRPWLFRIARNEAITILRARRETVVFDEAAVPGRGTDDVVAAREELRALSSDLANLSERQRDALILRELGGFGHQDIAQCIGSSAGAVKQAIWEARGALRTCREGREMPCLEVQRTLAEGDARHLRQRRLRAHLRNCPGCRRFQAGHERPRLLFPLMPATAAALLKQLLSGPASATHGLSLAVAGAVQAVGAKILISVSVVAIVAGGAAVAMHDREAPPPPAPAALIDLHPAARTAAPVSRDAPGGSTTTRPPGPVTGTGGTAITRTAPRDRWRPASGPEWHLAAPAEADRGSTADDTDTASTDRPADRAVPDDVERSVSDPPYRAAEPEPEPEPDPYRAFEPQPYQNPAADSPSRPSPPAGVDRPADRFAPRSAAPADRSAPRTASPADRSAPRTGGPDDRSASRTGGPGGPDPVRGGAHPHGQPPNGSAPGAVEHPRPPVPAGSAPEHPAEGPPHTPAAPDAPASRHGDPGSAPPASNGPPSAGDQPRDAAPPGPPHGTPDPHGNDRRDGGGPPGPPPQ